MKTILDRLAHWWIDRRLAVAAAERSAPGFEWTHMEFTADGMTATGTSPAIAYLAAEASAMLERGNAKNYIQFDMLARAGTPPVRVTVQWAHGVSPAQKAFELEEALKDMVQQHCLEPDGKLNDGFLSANENALAVLFTYDQVRQESWGRWSWVKP
jgi:hypothetical protein